MHLQSVANVRLRYDGVN
uniref:Uncharacterized protein n=1 Tax=Anguilla anguilla TaxID=7936 RepID=A0A0E9Q1X1_ANGAN